MNFFYVVFLMASMGAMAMDTSAFMEFAEVIELDEGDRKNLIEAVDIIFGANNDIFFEHLRNINQQGMPQHITQLANQHTLRLVLANPSAMLILGPASMIIKIAMDTYQEHLLDQANLMRIKRRKHP